MRLPRLWIILLACFVSRSSFLKDTRREHRQAKKRVNKIRKYTPFTKTASNVFPKTNDVPLGAQSPLLIRDARDNASHPLPYPLIPRICPCSLKSQTLVSPSPPWVHLSAFRPSRWNVYDRRGEKRREEGPGRRKQRG